MLVSLTAACSPAADEAGPSTSSTAGADSVVSSAVAPSSSDATTSTAAPTGHPDDVFTPLVAEVMSTPRWFTGSDGKVHLAYELELTNGTAVPAELRAVEVQDETEQ